MATREFKICLLGEQASGKTMLIEFLRDLKLSQAQSVMEDGNEEERYGATWGIKCHKIVHQVTENMTGHLNIWESGSAFLR